MERKCNMHQTNYIICVPLDDYSQENYHLSEIDENVHMKDYIFTREQLKKINPILNEFNKKFNLIIDLCEDEILTYDQLEEALKIIESNYIECEEYDKLIECIKYAISIKRPIIFWF